MLSHDVTILNGISTIQFDKRKVTSDKLRKKIVLLCYMFAENFLNKFWFQTILFFQYDIGESKTRRSNVSQQHFVALKYKVVNIS